MRKALFRMLRGRFGAPFALALPLVPLAVHESSLPALLGRYSFAAGVAGLALAGLALASAAAAAGARDAREAWLRSGLLVASSVLALGSAEALFCGALLQPKLPGDAAELEEIVTAHWPREVPLQRAPGRLRILGLADSFGWASGPRNYHYLLEERLRALGADVEMVNLSITALSPEEELELLRRFGPVYRPDLVLHGFYVGNDFTPLDGTPAHYRRITVRKRSGLAALHPRNLTLLQFLDGFLRVRRNQQLLARETGPHGTFSADTFLWIASLGMQSYRAGSERSDAWARTARTLDEIRAAARGLGADYALVVHPERTQVEERLRAQVASRYALDPGDYDVGLPQAFLRAYAGARGVPCVDLLPAFRERGREGGLYRPRDEHYNDAGNALAAERLVAAAEALGLNPLPPVGARGG